MAGSIDSAVLGSGTETSATEGRQEIGAAGLAVVEQACYNPFALEGKVKGARHTEQQQVAVCRVTAAEPATRDARAVVDSQASEVVGHTD